MNSAPDREREGLAKRAATAICSAFADYMERFHAITSRAKARFEDRDWHASHREARARLELYSHSMDRIKTVLHELLGERDVDRALWVRIKQEYDEAGDKLNFELARTYFSSVTRRVFSTVGVNPDIEFASLELAIHDWEPQPQILRRYAGSGNTRTLLTRILEDYRFNVDYRDLTDDIRLATERVERRVNEAFRLADAPARDLVPGRE